MNQDKYQCNKCKQVFPKTREDKEAIKEFNEKFPGVPLNESTIVCQDCYFKIIDAWEEIKENRRRMR